MKVRCIANAHAIGGGEMSSANIMSMLVGRGHDVRFHPTKGVNPKYPMPKGVVLEDSIEEGTPSGECDALFLYANDFVYKLRQNKDTLFRLMDGAKRNVLVVNFCTGDSCQEWFASRLDLVMFLNTTKQTEYLSRLRIHPMETVSLPPPVFLDEYLKIEPDYSKVSFVRHGRYNTKYWVDDTLWLMDKFQGMFPTSEFWFMATPPFLRDVYADDSRFHLLGWDETSVSELLKQGSLFHYRLPNNLRDQGPRVIVEAMAAGIPVIADSRDGARDRVTSDTGWLCNSLEDYIRAVTEVRDNRGILAEKGKAAKQRAREKFNPERWCDHILGCLS